MGEAKSNFGRVRFEYSCNSSKFKSHLAWSHLNLGAVPVRSSKFRSDLLEPKLNLGVDARKSSKFKSHLHELKLNLVPQV
jgi:hypothetical protein